MLIIFVGKMVHVIVEYFREVYQQVLAHKFEEVLNVVQFIHITN